VSVKIDFNNVVKKYGDTVIIPGLSFTVNKGEFFTLLGPSGCGKTTLLRMVAGFNSIEGGEISFNGNVINNLPPGKRNIGMVFQNYAIFPHMNVKKNIAFGLTNRNVDKQEIEKRVEKILETVKIEQYKDRMPERLSGGQQQRVALARAIVIEPDVLLMDEPLSNLDAKLRVEMRNAIKEIQKSVAITTIYVTHDQEEAMAVSDRIAIMDGGVIQHIGSPSEIYHRPANVFVATFIGHSTILNGKVSGTKLSIGSYTETINKIDFDGNVLVSVRPEEFYLSNDNSGLKCTITSSVFLGAYTQNFALSENGERIEFSLQSADSKQFSSGETVFLKVYPDRINIFDENRSRNLSARG
jgi:iron(III) transport system ATP-binding protein